MDFVAPEETNQPALLTFEQLRDGVRKSYREIEALEVEYVLTIHSIDTAKGLIPVTSCHFAFKGEMRFKSQAELIEGERQLDRAANYAFDELSDQDFIPQFEEGHIRPPDEKQPIVDIDTYIGCLAIPLTDKERASVDTTAHLLPYSLDIRDNEWKVLPTLAIVDGVTCHVIESKYKQRIWIDPKIGFAIRFRENPQFNPNDPDANLPLQSRFAFRDFQEMSDGLWLPRYVESISYNSMKQPKDRWNQPSVFFNCRVSKLELNDRVLDSLFKLTFPPGTVVRDSLRNRYYRVGDANEMLEIVVAEAQNALSNSGSGRRTWLIITNALIVVILALIVGYRLLAGLSPKS